MKNRLAQLRKNSLVIKIFVVMVVSIITVSLLITINTIRMSEKLFVETFSIMNHKVIDQIERNLETFSHSVATVSNKVQQSNAIKQFLTEEESDPLALAKAYYEINQQMENISSTINLYPVNIVITGENNRSFSTHHHYWPISAEDLRNHSITARAYKQPQRLLYQSVVEPDRPMIVATKSLEDQSKAYGMLYIAIRETDFKQMYMNFTNEENHVIVVDPSGTIVSSNQNQLIGATDKNLNTILRATEDDTADYEDVELFGKKYMLISTYLPTFDLYFINLIDKKLLMNGLINKEAIVLISLVIVLLALFTIFFITRKMTKSLTRLVQQISNLAKHNFGQYVTVSGSYETRELASTFNGMLDELQDYVEKLVETEKKQRNAELAALQQQINPHFLYNTLASIKILVQQGEKEKSAETIHALISLLQHTIGEISETITVAEELENMKSYVYINQVRYGERIKVNYFIAPDCLHYYVPKLMIQPFIENAFFHAFNKKQDGHIHILIAREGTTLVCEVVDNGDGMIVEGNRPTKRRTKRKLFSGIGVRNVDERIGLLYGEQYGVDISSQIGEGTKVKITLPLIEESENNTKNERNDK
ncbi:sensor histidine kinase [Bacillus sp. FJAT-50079]|uniref:cache domain-containing sensor histidine kinase n=1 Tax=Bacillus sp. FJAT-50079 TaxID=2833577 RepID=UPI001BCA23DB|nr:sensor histidine kinase [Bacillus sp. FJAT-50079]MBS4208413.1 sensor histidine kinase [Bacillus sp. FJAT-50079]